MQKQIIKLFFLLVTFFMLPNFVRAAITFDANGKWETTFDCDEANTDIIWSCDGLSEGGSAVSGMCPTQITIPANNPILTNQTCFKNFLFSLDMVISFLVNFLGFNNFSSII